MAEYVGHLALQCTCEQAAGHGMVGMVGMEQEGIAPGIQKTMEHYGTSPC